MSMKAELRNDALQRRNALRLDVRANFAARLAVVGPPLVLECLPSVGKPVTAVFSPIGSEPDVRPLASALHAAGVPLVLPVDLSHGSPLIFRRWAPGDRLAVGPLGIAEPLRDALELDPDVIVVPLIAFDPRGPMNRHPCVGSSPHLGSQGNRNANLLPFVSNAMALDIRRSPVWHAEDVVTKCPVRRCGNIRVGSLHA